MGKESKYKNKEKDSVKASIAAAREQIKYRREEIRGMKSGTDARKDATAALIKLEKDKMKSIFNINYIENFRVFGDYIWINNTNAVNVYNYVKKGSILLT